MRTVIALAVPLLLVLAFACVKRTAAAKPPDRAQVDPRQILYSLPTLCDALPATRQGTVPTDGIVILEDDWRQIEFTAVADRASINTQLLNSPTSR
jgi:hypothetical protein